MIFGSQPSELMQFDVDDLTFWLMQAERLNRRPET